VADLAFRRTCFGGTDVEAFSSQLFMHTLWVTKAPMSRSEFGFGYIAENSLTVYIRMENSQDCQHVLLTMEMLVL
jgi:hypothetical protein